LNPKKNNVLEQLLGAIVLICCCIVSILYAPLSQSHADHDKARYVSADGIDAGKCDNASAPCNSVSYAGLQSNKGDRIRVAAGNYVVDDVDTLFIFE